MKNMFGFQCIFITQNFKNKIIFSVFSKIETKNTIYFLRKVLDKVIFPSCIWTCQIDIF